MVQSQTPGLMGDKLNPNGSSTSSPRPSGPKGPQGKVQDEKTQELEQDFKRKHLGVLGVLVWIL